jgi:PAS domain S-box-containing protein
MSTQENIRSQEDIDALHQYYMEIINSMPNIVYWVDKDCNLKGCNTNFINLLGLNSMKDLSGTPYQQMEKFAHWSHERIERFKLDDMKVLFSGESLYNIEEKPVVGDKGKIFYFQCNRVPMYDKNKQITGLIVVLTDVSMNKAVSEHLNAQLDNTVDNKDSLQEGHLPNVLMVEDNVIAQNVEKALLTSLHCQVDIAGTADSAVEIFSPGKYDLVLMDIGLEGSSGYVVAKKLRQKEQDTDYHVPIIALTGYQADIVKYDCQHYFMEGAISKPLTSEQAEQIIKHYVYHLDVSVSGLKTT